MRGHCSQTVGGLMLALLLVGGCRQPPSAAPVQAPSPSSVQLTFWHIQSYQPTKGVVQAAVDRFVAAHPGVAVQVVPLQADLYKNKLQVAIAGNRAPDLFHTWGGGVLAAYAQEGKVLELTQALGSGRWPTFLPAALDFCRTEGRTWALPADVGIVLIWYNRALFEQHGLQPPKTWEDLLALCRRLRAAGIIPFALGNKDQWPGSFFYVYLAQRLGGVAAIRSAYQREPGGSFAAPFFVEAGRRLRQLVELSSFPEGFNGLTVDQARRLFFTGKAAMMLMGSWLLAHAQEEAPDLLPDLDLCAFPSLKEGEGDPHTLIGGVNAAYAISSSCAHPEVAVELLRELTSPATMQAWAKTGRLPAATGMLEGSEAPTLTHRMASLLEAAPAVQLYFDQLLGPQLGKRHLEAVQGLLAGTFTPTQAAELVEKEAAVDRG